MKRKVIQLAHRTHVVSLPSKWVKRYDIHKGDELEVEENGQQLIISTISASDSEKIQINADELGTDVLKRWVISSLHKSGYDEIEILYKDPKVIDIVQDVLREVLLGFTVVEHTKNRFVIKSIAHEQEKEFDILLRRAFLVTKNMGEGIYDYLKEGNQAQLTELLPLEKSNNQLTNVVHRILNKRGFKDGKKTTFAYVIAWNLEKVCDHYKDLVIYLSNNPKTKLSDSTLEMLHDANNYFTEYYELFYNFDIKKLNSLHKKKNDYNLRFQNLVTKGNQADAIVLSSLNEFVIKVSDFSASMIAINIKPDKSE